MDEGDVEEDGQDTSAVRCLSAVRGSVLDAFSEWQTTHWPCRAVSPVRHCTGVHHDAAGPW